MEHNFRFLYRTALRQSYEEGQLSDKDYEILMNALRRPRRCKGATTIDLMDEIEKYTMEQVPKGGKFWEFVVDWLKENWVSVLKFLLSLLVLVI
jgi:hypothetical protein